MLGFGMSRGEHVLNVNVNVNVNVGVRVTVSVSVNVRVRGVNSLAKHPERVGTGPKDKNDFRPS